VLLAVDDGGFSASADAPTDVTPRLLLLGVLEQVVRRAVLDEMTVVEEHGDVGDPTAWARLWVTTIRVSAGVRARTSPRPSRSRLVERRVGSSSSRTSGDRQGAGEAQELLLAPETERGVAEPVFYCVQSPTSVRRRSQTTSSCLPLRSGGLHPGDHVVRIDMGKGFGRWKSMPNAGGGRGRLMPECRCSLCPRSRHIAVEPGTRSFIRLSVRMYVDLPEPVGPIRAVMVPRLKRHVECR